ncbi:hypothetical protein LSTR_LSTR009400 [Laodelphax striatellus]|uniref:Rad4 beta-hairpin domain-containing protein n=1 Tax=Laodelphax striatellus TaxID=195883 RepID=A0A482WH35_LAOST|nr:hypothetical protein LSTR_LSTR009400 [Laodelphax striatellus]
MLNPRPKRRTLNKTEEPVSSKRKKTKEESEDEFEDEDEDEFSPMDNTDEDSDYNPTKEKAKSSSSEEEEDNVESESKFFKTNSFGARKKPPWYMSKPSPGTSSNFKSPAAKQRTLLDSDSSSDEFERVPDSLDDLGGFERLNKEVKTEDSENDMETDSKVTEYFDFSQIIQNQEVLKAAAANKKEKDGSVLPSKRVKQPSSGKKKIKNGLNDDVGDNDVMKLLAMGEGAKLEVNKNIKKRGGESDSEDSDDDEYEETKPRHTKGVEVTIALPNQHKKKEKKACDVEAALKRRFNLVKKENQVFAHKVHLLCWVAHGNYLNSVLNCEDLMGVALSIIPSNYCYPPKRCDLTYLENFVKWFREKIKIDPVLGKDVIRPDRIVTSQSLQAQFNKQMANSRLDQLLLFIATLRALGLLVRLIINLRPVPLKPPVKELFTFKSPQESVISMKGGKSKKVAEGDKAKKEVEKEEEEEVERGMKTSKENKAKNEKEGTSGRKPSKENKVKNEEEAAPSGEKTSKENIVEMDEEGTKIISFVKENKVKIGDEEEKVSVKKTTKKHVEDNDENCKKTARKNAKKEENVEEDGAPDERRTSVRQSMRRNVKENEGTNKTSSTKTKKGDKDEASKKEGVTNAKKEDDKNEEKDQSSSPEFIKRSSRRNQPNDDVNKKEESSNKRSSKRNAKKEDSDKGNEKESLDNKEDESKEKAKQGKLRSKAVSKSKTDDVDESVDFEEEFLTRNARRPSKIVNKIEGNVTRSSRSSTKITEKVTPDDSMDFEEEFVTSPMLAQLKIVNKIEDSGSSSTRSSRSSTKIAEKVVSTLKTNKVPDESTEKLAEKKGRTRSLSSAKKSEGGKGSRSKSMSNKNEEEVGNKSDKKSAESTSKYFDNKTDTTINGCKDVEEKETGRGKRQKKKVVENLKEAESSEEELEEEEEKKKKNGKRRTSEAKKSSKKKGNESDEEFELESSYFKSKKQIDRRVLSSDDDAKVEANKKNKKKNQTDEWAEVFLEAEEKWICVDLTKGMIHCVQQLYSSASQPVTHVLGWENSGYMKDVTRRYVPHYMTATRKQRVDDGWWLAALRAFRPPRDARNREEDEDLDRQMEDQPLPKSISEYKNHPLYALQRHLLKFQAIYPPDAPTLGFIRNEPVFSRSCVAELHCRESWIKFAKVVRAGEEPYKVVKARPKFDKMTGEFRSDLPLPLFGPWQVDDYVPPPAKDGKVPRNEYGNVELFQPSMLPAGTVHLKLPGLNRVAKKLQIDCAAAVVGWDFHGGSSHVVMDGFVVCEEFKDTLTEAWHQEQQEAERRAREKMEQKVYGNWKRLIKGLLIREKLKLKYGFEIEDEVAAGSSGKGQKSKKGLLGVGRGHTAGVRVALPATYSTFSTIQSVNNLQRHSNHNYDNHPDDPVATINTTGVFNILPRFIQERIQSSRENTTDGTSTSSLEPVRGLQMAPETINPVSTLNLHQQRPRFLSRRFTTSTPSPALVSSVPPISSGTTTNTSNLIQKVPETGTVVPPSSLVGSNDSVKEVVGEDKLGRKRRRKRKRIIIRKPSSAELDSKTIAASSSGLEGVSNSSSVGEKTEERSKNVEGVKDEEEKEKEKQMDRLVKQHLEERRRHQIPDENVGTSKDAAAVQTPMQDRSDELVDILDTVDPVGDVLGYDVDSGESAASARIGKESRKKKKKKRKKKKKERKDDDDDVVMKKEEDSEFDLGGGDEYFMKLPKTEVPEKNHDEVLRDNNRRINERSERLLKRPKKNYLSEEKVTDPQIFAYDVGNIPRQSRTDDEEEELEGEASEDQEVDQSPSASHGHKHKEKKHHKEKHEKGGGEEHHSHHKSSSGKKGDKGYKGYHKHEKGEKGHHDKESHKGEYKDTKGKKKKHKEEAGHYGAHHKSEKGKKGAKFGESGEHKKGHSTKGEHNIHKKDEYLKKHEFYDEHHEGGEHEKHGGYHSHHGHKKGGKHKSGHHKSGHHEGHHGKKGHHKKGGHHKDHKGHKEAAGHEKHHSHKSEYGKKGGHKEGKKWGYSHKKD